VEGPSAELLYKILILIDCIGYGRFFNEVTDWCNDLYLFPWIVPWPSFSRAKLTKELRNQANALTIALNQRIVSIIHSVNQIYIDKGSQKRVYFVDTDETYQGDRWCDGEFRKGWRDDTLFFNVDSPDRKGDGSVVTQSPDHLVVDIGGLNPATCFDAADDAGDDTMMLRCVIAELYSQSGGAALGTVYTADDGSGATLQIVSTGKDVSTLSNTAKAFHPKTYPLANIAGRVYESWLNVPR
jgi:hypothetical protein